MKAEETQISILSLLRHSSVQAVISKAFLSNDKVLAVLKDTHFSGVVFFGNYRGALPPSTFNSWEHLLIHPNYNPDPKEQGQERCKPKS